jgi:hypothetical protein
MGRLQDAEDDHDRARLDAVDGVTRQMLEADKSRWCDIGVAITALAGLIYTACRTSAFCPSRPRVADIVVRVSEAIDDQLDDHAWRVADAAARLAAVGR